MEAGRGLWAREVVSRRVREARASHPDKPSRRQLAARLSALGVKSSERTIERLEAGGREPGLTETLAIAWVLGVAPVHLIVPFEEPEAVVENEHGERMPPTFRAPNVLRVAENVEMHPIEARGWLSGAALRSVGEEPAKAWLRFHYDEAPPPVRYGYEKRAERGALVLRRIGEAERRKSEGHATPQDEALLERFRGFVAPLYELVEGEIQKRKEK